MCISKERPMMFVLYMVFLITPAFSIRIGCIANVTMEGIVSDRWFNKTNNCNVCMCYMYTRNFSAFNCYNRNAINQTNCLMFDNYSNDTSSIRLVSGQNGSSVCFIRFPSQTTKVSSLYTYFHQHSRWSFPRK